MYELLHQMIAPYYLYIKMIHVPAVTVWSFSVIMGYYFFLVPVMQAWRKNESDAGLAIMRNWVFERFDHGVKVEHYAFPLVLLSGVLLIIAGGWGPESRWLMLKLSLIMVAVVPMEIVDYYISHFHGNKRHLREQGDNDDWEAYEDALHRHWWFFLITTPLVGLVILGVFFLAFIKPF